MERIHGPTLAEAMLSGVLEVTEGAAMLAHLHLWLHTLEWPGAAPLLHCDLHPLNVLLADDGPVVIDWANARTGAPGLDIALTALILGQVIACEGHVGGVQIAAGRTAMLEEFLVMFLAAVHAPWRHWLGQAADLRSRDPLQTPEERANLPSVVALVERLSSPAT